jgi:hypothetical protein
MSNNPNLVPRSFFFTDPGAISQSAEQSFGPLGPDRFRLTAKFSVAAPSPAFAVCTGTVLVQPQTTDSSRVNLILRPFKQPIQGLNIRYFVYRGLQLSDFFSNGNVIPTSASSSDLITSVNADFSSYYSRLSPDTSLPEFKAAFIGYDPEKQSDSTLLSDLFFKRSTLTDSGTNSAEAAPFELPLISAGSSIGNFKSGECGFEVVLAYGDYGLPEPNDEFRFDLAYARASEKIIDISNLTDDSQKKQVREQITQFIDAAAYYGFHYRDGGSVSLKSGTGKVTKTGAQIYDDVISKFYSKNNVYLYFQSDRGRTYNFYGNYQIGDADHSMNYGIDELALAPRSYDTLSWPLIVENRNPANGAEEGNIYIQFGTDNNENTALYELAGTVDLGVDRRFGDIAALKSQDESNTDGLTRVIALSNPTVVNNGNRLFVATFNIILYQGKKYRFLSGSDIDDNGNTYDVFNVREPYDDLFGRVNSDTLIQKAGTSDSGVTEDHHLKLFCRYQHKTVAGIMAFQASRITDSIAATGNERLQRVTFVTETVDSWSDVVALRGSVSQPGNTQSDLILFNDGTYQLPSPFFQLIKPFSDNAVTVSGIEINTSDGSVPNILLIGITLDEYNVICNLVAENSISNAGIHLRNFYEDDTAQTAGEVTFEKFKLGVAGEGQGQLRAYLPETDIVIYSLDRSCFFSPEYSKYMTKSDTGTLVPILNNNLDLAE